VLPVARVSSPSPPDNEPESHVNCRSGFVAGKLPELTVSADNETALPGAAPRAWRKSFPFAPLCPLWFSFQIFNHKGHKGTQRVLFLVFLNTNY
jgi:hypothetical protein